MNELRARIRSFLISEDGPTATEYAVMLGLIIVVAIATIGPLGVKIKDMFKTVDDKLVIPS